MPIAKEATTDPALEAQVFWYKYRREIAILLGLAVLGIVGVAGYRLYRDRREATAATLFSAAKTPAAYEDLINQYSNTGAAASAYLLLADAQRKDRKYAEANATLEKFLEKFPRHELATTARMAMAANLQAMGKEDEAFATYQQIASANVPGFNAPMALIEQVHILQEKGKTDDHDAISRQLRSHGSEPVAANVFEDGETGNTAGCRTSENGRFGDRYGSTNHENNASCAEWCALSGSETVARAEYNAVATFQKNGGDVQSPFC
jgi:predicted negative regulator of RcsB-dependent stress response